jgi:CBS domain-containing protein
MRAKDVMTAPAICVVEDTSVGEIAKRLLAHRISAVPVTDGAGRLIGIVSEGDLVRRVESGTQREPAWWLTLFAEEDTRAREYARSRGRRAADVMTRHVVTVGEEATLAEIATLLERHRIKRVPVVRDGKVIGIVSRANLLHGLASQPPAAAPPPGGEALRERITAEIERAGVPTAYVNVVVGTDAVHLWGLSRSEQQREAAHIAAQTIAGDIPVVSHLSVPRDSVWAVMGAE